MFVSFVVKETRHIMRDKRTVLILFGLPVVLMLLFGFAITTDIRDVRTVVVTSHMDALTRRAVESLSASEYFVVVSAVSSPSEAEQWLRNQQADLAVVFEEGFSEGRGGMQFIVDGSDPNMSQQWVNYARATIGAGLSGGPSEGSVVVNTKMLYNLQMKSGYNFVPAIMGMLLMLICAMMTSISIVREKERGTMELLLVSPVRPLMIIIAKVVPYMVLAFAILTATLLMSRFVLEVPLAGSVFWIYVVSSVYIALALSLGLVISNVASSQLVALLLSAMVLLLPIVMLSGMLFPVESMPRVLQWVSAAVPPRYYIEAMRKLMIMGVGIGDVVREVSVLTGMTVFFVVVALLKFKTRLE